LATVWFLHFKRITYVTVTHYQGSGTQPFENLRAVLRTVERRDPRSAERSDAADGGRLQETSQISD